MCSYCAGAGRNLLGNSAESEVDSFSNGGTTTASGGSSASSDSSYKNAIASAVNDAFSKVQLLLFHTSHCRDEEVSDWLRHPVRDRSFSLHERDRLREPGMLTWKTILGCLKLILASISKELYVLIATVQVQHGGDASAEADACAEAIGEVA